MGRTWLLITVGALVGLVPQRSLAQSAASVTVRARVRPAPKPPTQSPGAAPLGAPDAGRPRTVEGLEVFTLDVAGSPLMRVFLCPSGTRVPGDSRATCLWRVDDGSEQVSHAPPEPQQITVHWPDFPQWPAFLVISNAARAAPVQPGHYVAYLTIVAEY